MTFFTNKLKNEICQMFRSHDQEILEEAINSQLISKGEKYLYFFENLVTFTTRLENNLTQIASSNKDILKDVKDLISDLNKILDEMNEIVLIKKPTTDYFLSKLNKLDYFYNKTKVTIDDCLKKPSINNSENPIYRILNFFLRKIFGEKATSRFFHSSCYENISREHKEVLRI